MTRRRVLVALTVVALIATGCGRYALRGSKGPTTTTGRDVAVGAGLQGDNGTSTTTPSGQQPAATTTPTPTARPAASNGATNTDLGLRFVFTVGNKTTYGPKEDFPLEVVITNVSGHALTYEPNQPYNFVLGHPAGSTGQRWFDSDCSKPKPAGSSPALTLQPGAQLHLSAEYPGPPSASNRELCRRSPDQYLAGAVFALCDNIRDSDGSCDPSTLRYAKSIGVAITITR